MFSSYHIECLLVYNFSLYFLSIRCCRNNHVSYIKVLTRYIRLHLSLFTIWQVRLFLCFWQQTIFTVYHFPQITIHLCNVKKLFLRVSFSYFVVDICTILVVYMLCIFIYTTTTFDPRSSSSLHSWKYNFIL